MKKHILLLLLLLVCGCSSIPNIEDDIEEFVEKSEDLLKVKEILTQKEYDDAIFGLALVIDEYEEEVIYLDGIIIDEADGISTETHGAIEPLYIYSESEIIVNPSSDKEYESDPKKNYQKCESEKKTYYVGIVQGNQSIKYDGMKSYSKQLEFTYRGNVEKITFWIVDLTDDVDFDIDKLTY